jgi:serine/threonine protein kinase
LLEELRVDENPGVEIEMLLALRGRPNILQLLDAGKDSIKGYAVMEPRGANLTDIVFGGIPELNESIIRAVMRGLLLGVSHIHHAGFAHLGSSLENTMVVDPAIPGREVKIMHSGFAVRLGQTASGAVRRSAPMMVGDPIYYSPEVWSAYASDNSWRYIDTQMRRHERFFGDKVDIWCCGLMLLVMVYKRTPKWFTSPFEVLHGDSFRKATHGMILEVPELASIVESRRYSDGLWGIMQQMLQFDPRERPTAVQALANGWFA